MKTELENFYYGLNAPPENSFHKSIVKQEHRVSDEQFLEWYERSADTGMGYLPVYSFPYDESYLGKYMSYKGGWMDIALTHARVNFVNQFINRRDYASGDIVDVGVGSGSFMDEMCCIGYDVNPAAVAFLKNEDVLASPVRTYPIKTYWDSLEHIPDLERELSTIGEWCFVSCPVYDSFDHVLKSKHFRPDEHYWYWTKKGLCLLMQIYDFVPVEITNFETLLGREDILTFAFRRQKRIGLI